MSLVKDYMFIIISVLIEDRNRFSVVYVLLHSREKKSTYFFEDPSYIPVPLFGPMHLSILNKVFVLVLF